MAEFDMRQFTFLLQIAPETKPMVEPPEHNEYLQKHVFNVLKEKGRVDLRQLDWSAFAMKDLRSGWHVDWLNTTPSGWLHGINSFVHKTSGMAAGRREFF